MRNLFANFLLAVAVIGVGAAVALSLAMVTPIQPTWASFGVGVVALILWVLVRPHSRRELAGR